MHNNPRKEKGLSRLQSPSTKPSAMVYLPPVADDQVELLSAVQDRVYCGPGSSLDLDEALSTLRSPSPSHGQKKRENTSIRRQVRKKLQQAREAGSGLAS